MDKKKLSVKFEYFLFHQVKHLFCVLKKNHIIEIVLYEYPCHMFRLRNKKIDLKLHKCKFIQRPGIISKLEILLRAHAT